VGPADLDSPVALVDLVWGMVVEDMVVDKAVDNRTFLFLFGN
jgi:hypothetical protein